MQRRLAFIMAGGSGERFWPVSTAVRPKQFLRLASPDANLLAQSVERAAHCVGAQNTFIATSKLLAPASVETCPQIPAANVLAEPHKRNTTGCLVWVAANIMARDPEGWPNTTVAVLTADQRVSPESEFQRTVENALSVAEETGSIVTIGIPPDRPETGFGYIEVGEPQGPSSKVSTFREKPDFATAQEFVKSERFLWNSGMFFFTLPAFIAELEQTQPDIARTTRQIAGHIAQNEVHAAEDLFATLPSISIDYAVMEKAKEVRVVPATFAWDDLGAWDSVARSYPPDDHANVALGSHRLLDASGNVIYNDNPSQEVCLLGIDDLVVVVTKGTVLVCPKSRAQEVKRFLQQP